jgi:sensor histidine kinase regulating citrate/malate metabolism
MTPPELGSMLSNILENALEACRKTKCDKRFVTFIAEIEDDILKIELQNTASGEVEIRNNMPISTKKNGGTGTKSVLYVVERYHGMLNFRQNGDTFITQIVLPV